MRDVPRLVSLVPSLTEALIDWGLAGQILGRTRWCTEPADVVASIEAVGGTKNPDVARIIGLAPDLVVVNREENRIEDVRELEAAGIVVHVTHPRSVAEAAAMARELGVAVGRAEKGDSLALLIESALVALRAGASRPRTFCPIWRRPWMSFSRRTYIGDMLEAVGCRNLFADEPAERGDFFEVGLARVRALGPELVVLPDEPYEFGPVHADELRAAGIDAPVVHVDGKDLAWYGPRVPAALGRLARQVREACGELAP